MYRIKPKKEKVESPRPNKLNVLLIWINFVLGVAVLLLSALAATVR